MMNFKLWSYYLILFFFICMLGSATAQDQYLLALDKPGNVNRKRFYVNDKIEVKTKQEKQWHCGEIDLIMPDYIVLEQKLIPLSDISHLRIKRLDWLHFRLRKIALGGALFISFFTINSLANNDQPILTTGEWMAPLGLISPWIIIQPFRKRSYKIGNSRVLKVLHTI